MNERTWGDGSGPCNPVTVVLHDVDRVQCVASARHADNRLEGIGWLFLDHSRDAVHMARQTILGHMPPAILADWIEDHPECWRAPGGVRGRAVAEICKRLRAVPL